MKHCFYVQTSTPNVYTVLGRCGGMNTLGKFHKPLHALFADERLPEVGSGWGGLWAIVWGEEHLGPNYIEGVTTSFTVCQLCETVDCFGIGVRCRRVEVGKDFFVPVIYGAGQLTKGNGHITQPVFPGFVFLFGLGSAERCIPDAKQFFFQLVSLCQARVIDAPQIQDKPLVVIQIAFTLEQRVAVVHQCSTFFVAETGADLFADDFNRLVCHPHQVELIHHDPSVGQCGLHRHAVRVPHIHCDQFNAVSVGEGQQPLDDGFLVSALEHVYNGTFLNVAQDATGPVQQVQLVNAQPSRGFKLDCSFQFPYVVFEDVSDGVIVEAEFTGNAGEGSVEALALNIFGQSFGNAASLVNMPVFYGESVAALPATEALPGCLNDHLFAVNWQVSDTSVPSAKAVEVCDTGTTRAELWSDAVLRFDDVIVGMFYNVGYLPVGKVENVQLVSPQWVGII